MTMYVCALYECTCLCSCVKDIRCFVASSNFKPNGKWLDGKPLKSEQFVNFCCSLSVVSIPYPVFKVCCTVDVPVICICSVLCIQCFVLFIVLYFVTMLFTVCNTFSVVDTTCSQCSVYSYFVLGLYMECVLFLST